MKKSLFLSAMVALTAVGIVGCAPTSNPTETPTTNPTTVPTTNPTTTVEEHKPVIETPVTISMWVKSDINSPLYASFVETFKQVEPNVTVNLSALEDVSNYNDLQKKVLTGILAKQYPNIIQAYPGHVADYHANDIAINIQPYFENAQYGWTAEERSQFNLSAGQQFGFEGTYCLPFNKSSEVLYYNRDKLVGLDLSAQNTNINNGYALTDEYLQNLTWEEIFDRLGPALIAYDEANPDEKLIDKSDKDWSVFFHEDDANHFITTMKQYDVDYTSVDSTGKGSVNFVNAEAKALRKKFANAVTDHLVATRWSSGGKYSANQLLLGHSLLAVNSTVGASYFYHDEYITDVGIGHVPYAEGQKRYVVEQGTSLAFLSHGNELQDLASWLFYKHMTSYENQLTYSLGSGYLPIRADIYDDPAYIAFTDLDQFSGISAEKITAEVFNFAEQLQDDYFTEAPFEGSTAVRNAVSYLNSGIYAEAKKGYITDAFIDDAFEDAYNNAMNG